MKLRENEVRVPAPDGGIRAILISPVDGGRGRIPGLDRPRTRPGGPARMARRRGSRMSEAGERLSSKNGSIAVSLLETLRTT